MIEIESRELPDIPVLHAYPVGQKDTPLPCDFLSRLYFVQSGV